MNHKKRLIEIISVKMLGENTVSFNSAEYGIMSESELIENINLKNEKYFIFVNDKKIFFKWDEKYKNLIEPTPDQLKSKISET